VQRTYLPRNWNCYGAMGLLARVDITLLLWYFIIPMGEDSRIYGEFKELVRSKAPPNSTTPLGHSLIVDVFATILDAACFQWIIRLDRLNMPTIMIPSTSVRRPAHFQNRN
jgi:hypothetical protein